MEPSVDESGRAPGLGTLKPHWRAAAICCGLFLAVSSGCATHQRLPPAPVVSPTGFVYQVGTPPTETRYSQTATLLIRMPSTTERGLEQALAGIASDSTNPVHYFLAGAAHARLGHFAEANQMFARAQQIYPAYELQIEPEREAAWADAFNQGAHAYGEGNMELATKAWQDAIGIFDLRPEAHRSLAQLDAGEGRYDDAIRIYLAALAGLDKKPATRVLQDPELQDRATARAEIEGSLAELLLLRNRFAEAEPLLRRQIERHPADADLKGSLASALVGLGRTEEARAIYTSLLSENGLAATQLFNLGVALFRADEFGAAANAFLRLTQLRPASRDAWFNYANSLFAAREWQALSLAGDRLIELDPLSENAGLITARAHLELGDQPGALRGVERVKSAPVYLDGLSLKRANDEVSVTGLLIGNRAEPGATIRLGFTFYGDTGVLGSVRVNLTAPAEGVREPFEVTFRGTASFYSYEILP